MSRLVAVLDGVTGPWAYVIVGLLVTLEASAFVGIAIPGEAALLVGGFYASTGRASLLLMMAVATIGAVAGDSFGYAVGRRLGPALEASRLGRRIGAARWQRGEAYIQHRGGRAVFAGRFVGVLRALVPAIAGAGRMPYRTFLMWNVAGGLVWAPTFVLFGYVTGSSYPRVERYAGRGTLVLVGAALVVAAIAGARRFRRRPVPRRSSTGAPASPAHSRGR